MGQFNEIFRRMNSNRYPQVINGIDVNRMNENEIYEYFVSPES